jgi:hypothetical protein
MVRVSYPPVEAGHLLIDGAILNSVIGKKAFCFSAMQNVANWPILLKKLKV